MLKPYLLSLRLHRGEHNKDIAWVRARGVIVLSSSQRGLLSDRVMPSDSFLAKEQSYMQYIKKRKYTKTGGYFYCFCLVPAVFSLSLETKKMMITEKINKKKTPKNLNVYTCTHTWVCYFSSMAKEDRTCFIRWLSNI